MRRLILVHPLAYNDDILAFKMGRPFALLVLIIDLEEAPISLISIVIVLPETLDRNNGVDASYRRHYTDILPLKNLRGQTEKRSK
jgi:hypothetical protein